MATFTRDGVRVRKSERMRLAKAELLLSLAMKAQEWADDVSDANSMTKPFEQWPDDDRFKQLAITYGLTGRDLGSILTKLAQQLEDRADRAGYDETWLELL